MVAIAVAPFGRVAGAALGAPRRRFRVAVTARGAS